MTNFTHFDSVFMNMTQAFQELLSIAAKADTDAALVMLLETVEDMTQQLDSAYDSHVEKVDSHFDAAYELHVEKIDASDKDDKDNKNNKDDSTNQSESTIQTEQTDSAIDSVAAKAEDVDTNTDTNFDVDCDSALTQVRNNVAKLNIIVKAIMTGKANIKTHGKEQLLKFITDCYEGFEQILAFVSVVESEGGYTFPSQVTSYIKSRQSILITCYDNVAISE